MEEAQRNITIQTTSVQNGQDTDKVVSEMRILRSSLEKLLTAILNKDTNAYLDSSKVTDIITRKQNENEISKFEGFTRFSPIYISKLF